MTENWLDDARRASASKDAFEQLFHLIPGKIKQILKHLDPRSKSSRNIDKDIQKLSESEQKALQALLKYHQAFPLNYKFPKPRHTSKYRGKAKNQNHLIDKEQLRAFDKRKA